MGIGCWLAVCEWGSARDCFTTYICIIIISINIQTLSYFIHLSSPIIMQTYLYLNYPTIYLTVSPHPSLASAPISCPSLSPWWPTSYIFFLLLLQHTSSSALLPFSSCLLVFCYAGISVYQISILIFVFFSARTPLFSGLILLCFRAWFEGGARIQVCGRATGVGGVRVVCKCWGWETGIVMIGSSCFFSSIVIYPTPISSSSYASDSISMS